MRSSFLGLCVAAIGPSFVFAHHVLLVGKSRDPLWHDTSSAISTFSAAGLVDLALASLALPTGRVPSRPVVRNPVQADLFTHSEAYALILLEDASLMTFEAIDATVRGASAFHNVYPTAQASKVDIPVAVAHAFQSKYSSSMYCAGNMALCVSVEAKAPPEHPDAVQQVLAANEFLSPNNEQDVVFATQLAQVMQLTASLKQHGDGKMLYIVGLSSLQGEKQKLAQEAMASTIVEFLAQLMKKEQSVAAQVMTGSLPTTGNQAAALSRRLEKLATRSTDDETSAEDDPMDDERDAEEDTNDDETSAEDDPMDDERDAEEDTNDDETSAEDDTNDDESDAEDDVLDLATSSSAWDNVVNESLSTNTTNWTATGEASMSDIAEYQIILWTSVLLGAVLFMSVLAMANMDARRDSLLNAKFIADVNGRKSN